MKNNTKTKNKKIILSIIFGAAPFFCLMFTPDYSVYATGATSTITITTSGTAEAKVKPTTTGKSAVSSNYSFRVSTDNYTGYTVRVKAEDNTGRLIKTTACNSDDSSHCYISSISASATSITANNTWGYKPSHYNNATHTALFHPSPPTEGDTLRVTSSANAEGESDLYTIAIGVKTDLRLEPGDYSKTLTITAVGNPITYNIQYVDNSGSTVSGLPSSHQTGSINNGAGSVTLAPYPSAPASVPTRESYTFAGWCSEPTTNSGTECPGTTFTFSSSDNDYGSMDIDETANNTTLKLYALWEFTPLYFWDASLSDCGKNMWDNRDGVEREYTTVSLSGKCWMTTNLSLGKGTITTLNNTTTNLNDGLTSYDLPASSTSGFAENSTAYVYNSGSTVCGEKSPCYAYYSFIAATAGTNPSEGEATSDICPRGWRLPTRTDFTAIANTYNTGPKLVNSPWHAIYQGFYYGSRFDWAEGSYGYYWSSTTYNEAFAYYLYYSDTETDVIYSINFRKRIGYPIRCVKDS